MTYTGKLSEVLELLRKVGIAPGLDNEIDGVVGGLVGSVFGVFVMLLDRRKMVKGEGDRENQGRLEANTAIEPENKPEIKLEIKPLTDLRSRLDVSFFSFLFYFSKSQHIKSVRRLFMKCGKFMVVTFEQKHVGHEFHTIFLVSYCKTPSGE